MGTRTLSIATTWVAVLLLGASACSSGSGGPGGGKRSDAAQIKVTPANGEAKARPDHGVTVSTSSGRLNQVTVQANGRPVEGGFSPDRRSWKTRWTLTPGTSYTVTASARNSAGKAATVSSGFTTFKADRTFSATPDWILEGNRGRTYGVGLPIVLNFDEPVYNKANVERALEVSAEKPVDGAWRWVGDRQVIYRPKTYWPAHQKVTLRAHLSGVRGAKAMYGVRDLTRTYRIGAARISTVDLRKKHMTVTVDGRRTRSYGISAGMGTTREYTTTSGIHLTMEKGKLVVMESPNRKPGDPGYYKEPIGYAVRISNAGEYVHKTAGEEECLGRRNCSHGCVRQPARQAIWFFNTVQPADVVITTNSDRRLEWDNGWSYYQLPWEKWVEGSALRGKVR